MLVPPALRLGSRVHVIAPSGPFDRSLVLRGMGWLSERYRVTFRPDVFSRDGFLAGTDARRREEFSSALLDPSIDAIVTARGGHGLLRILDGLPFAALRRCPKWLVGFSDPTAMLMETTRIGVASLHAANVAGLGRSDALTRAQWISALEHPTVPREYTGRSWVKGWARGPLVGGNLTVLTMLAAMGRLRLPVGCILAIEDVTEATYRIDRMVSVLKSAGHLDQVAGFALGQFTDCSPGTFGVNVEAVLREHLCPLAPVVAGLGFGHETPNLPLTMGTDAILDGGAGTLVTPVAGLQVGVTSPHDPFAAIA